jgi:hypothetical protein
MSDYSCEEVEAAARAMGLTLTDDDLLDVTHRLNVIVAGLKTISHPQLDEMDPAPFLPPEDESCEQ